MALSWPVDAPVTQQFGTNPNDIQPNGHTGVDFGVGIGTTVFSADSGTVMYAGWASDLSGSNPWWIAPAFAGIVVVINHNDGYLTLYAHLNETNLNAGDFVEKGVEIGKSGSTGLSTGPHLHFEVLGWPLQPYNGFYGRLNPNLYCGGLSYQSSVTIASNQRVVGEYGAKERTSASTSGAEGRTFTHGDVLTFKGFVHGESVNGTDVWFVGGLSGTFFHASAFDDGDPHDLQDLTPPKVIPVPLNRRIVGGDVVRYRSLPYIDAPIKDEFAPGTVFDTFTKFVHGQAVGGNDIWFKGSQKGFYAWSGGFTNTGTAGLTEDPTPVGRTTGDSAVRFRKSPSLKGELIDTLAPNTSYSSFTVFTHGEAIDGNDIWFKGTQRGGYSWSGAFTEQSTSGMTEEVITKPVEPTQPTEPVTTAYKFTPDFDFVECIPAALPNFEFGNFPAKPEKVVIHQFGTPGVDTIGSTINTFTNPNMDRVASAHFVVSGKRIVQMVSLNDRAYHAGPGGNGWVGIETDPAQDADTIASVNILQKALAAKYGYTLQPIRHKEVVQPAGVPPTNTSCGTLINLQNYVISAPVTPTPTPTPEPVPTPQPIDDRAVAIAGYQRWLSENNQRFLEEYLKNH